MFLVGLTGGIGCGKTTVSNMFKDLNVPIIDSDQIARKVVERGRKALTQIVETFGDSVLERDGSLNRKALASIIFADPQKRSQLNAITHPEIAKEIFSLILQYFLRGHQFVIIDSPLLFEVNTWLKAVHKVIVVSCGEELQLQRIIQRDGLTKEEAASRINAQIPLEEKRKRASYIVYNEGSLADTRRMVEDIHKELKSLNAHLLVRSVVVAIAGGILWGIIWIIKQL